MTIQLQLDPNTGTAILTGLQATDVGAATSSDLTATNGNVTAVTSRVTTLESYDLASLSSQVAALNTLGISTSLANLQYQITAAQTLLTKISQTYTVSTQLQQPAGTLVQPASYASWVTDQKTHWGETWWTQNVNNVTTVGSNQQINFKNGRYLTQMTLNGRLILGYSDVSTIALSSYASLSEGITDGTVPQLKRILTETGDYSGSQTSTSFGADVTTALNAFKTRVGLTENGICDGACWDDLSNNSLAHWQLYPPGSTLVQPSNYDANVQSMQSQFGADWTTYVNNVTVLNNDQYVNFKNGRWLDEAFHGGALITSWNDVRDIASAQFPFESSGSTDTAIVKQLTRMLAQTGDLTSDPADGVFNDQVTGALNAFKTRVGLNANGTVDGDTWAALNNNGLPHWHV